MTKSWEDMDYTEWKVYLLQLKQELCRANDEDEKYFLNHRIQIIEREIMDYERFHRETEERMRKQKEQHNVA